MSEVLLRTSERSQFKRCRWAWARAYVDHLKPVTEAPALRFGTLVHKAMEKRYPPGVKRGPHPAKTFKRLYEREAEEAFHVKDVAEETWVDALDLGIDMLKGYVDKYGKDEEWKVIASEQAFQVSVFDDDGNYIVTYVGVVDGLWQHRVQGDLWVRDYKTCGNIGVEHLALDDQFGSYWTFVPQWLREQGLIKPKANLAGLMVDFLRKAKGDTRPVNELGQALNKPTVKEKKEFGEAYPGSVSKSQPAPRFLRHPVYRDEPEAEAMRERVIQEAHEMAAAREGSLAIYKNPGGAPPLNNCQFCGFRDMCELHEVGADWELLRDASMKTWDPYAEHELYDRP